MPKTKELERMDERVKTWDHHGSYRWSYFGEENKSRISHFLGKRLSGRNLDIGGGWYLYYSNSVVVDLSPVCLASNPAQEKLQFDIEQLAQGKKLPYPDHSFDSATLVSVWQYVKNADALIKE